LFVIDFGILLSSDEENQNLTRSSVNCIDPDRTTGNT